MTTEEKRRTLTVFCSARSCSRCPLNRGFKCGDGESFLKKKADGSYAMADRTVDKAYELAIEKKKAHAPAPPVTTVEKKRKPNYDAMHDCPHNCGLQCDQPDSQCAGCGWNPPVDANRRARLKYIFNLPTNKFALYGLRLKKKG